MLFGKHINPFYRKYWYYFALLIFFDIAVDILQLYIPKITGGVITVLKNAPEDFIHSSVKQVIIEGETIQIPFYYQNLTWTLCSIAVLAVLIFLGRMGWRVSSARIGAKIERDLRKEMYQNIQKLSLSYYSDKKVGGLLSYFTSDLQSIKTLFTDGMILLIDLTVLGSLSFFFMLQYSVPLAFICIIPLLLFVLLGGVVLKGETKRSKAAGDAFEDLSDYTEENLQGFSVIKAFRKENQKYDGFSYRALEAEMKNLKFANYSSLLDGGINLIILIMYLLLLMFGAYSLIEINPVFLGNIKDSGQFVTFAGYTDTLIWPMIAGGLLINEVSNAKAAYQRISTILDAKEELPDDNTCISHDHIEGNIRFSHLTFTYPGSKEPSLKDITFETKPGQMVGIIGRTGSGKSTLVTLLEKLYPLKKGQLSIDGDDISVWKKADLREHIGMVLQTSYLFSGSVNESIAFSDTDVGHYDKEKVREAGSFSCVEKDILQMQEGYDTMVGEKGSSVSGGQRQRISIARAVYKNPDVLILDDSLSAVDADTEKNILYNIRHQTRKTTTFLITHRVSALENCDLILVLDNGRLVGKGTNEELLKTCRLYQDISEMQKLEKEVN